MFITGVKTLIASSWLWPALECRASATAQVANQAAAGTVQFRDLGKVYHTTGGEAPA